MQRSYIFGDIFSVMFPGAVDADPLAWRVASTPQRWRIDWQSAAQLLVRGTPMRWYGVRRADCFVFEAIEFKSIKYAIPYAVWHRLAEKATPVAVPTPVVPTQSRRKADPADQLAALRRLTGRMNGLLLDLIPHLRAADQALQAGGDLATGLALEHLAERAEELRRQVEDCRKTGALEP